MCGCGLRKRKNSLVCRVCSSAMQGGAFNGNWAGGKTHHTRGYVMMKAPGHPRAENNSGYVFEHILVVESHIGRYLLPKENVHHVNGVKDDNRVVNLELWSRPQPTGVRARDALEWARQIIATYEPIEQKLGGGAGESNPESETP